MPRQDLLRAAEVVLLEAQRVNPLNTDHTANLARLYRTWADLTPADDAEARQALLDKSIAQYELAVTLSPNAAHLWNEKGNAHLARGERDLAEEIYLHSLAIDRSLRSDLSVAGRFLRRERGVRQVELNCWKRASPRWRPAARHSVTPGLYSYLSVAKARSGDTAGRHRRQSQACSNCRPTTSAPCAIWPCSIGTAATVEEAVNWANQAIDATNPDRVAEIKQLRNVLIEIYDKAWRGRSR